MSAADSVAARQLRAFIERIERLEEEKKTIADDIKDVKAEAKGCGFDVGAINAIIKLRKIDAAEREEKEAILDAYKAALGMLPQGDLFADDEPKGVDPKLVETVAKAVQTDTGKAALLAAVDIMISREDEQFDPETGEITSQSREFVAPAQSQTDYAAQSGDKSAATDQRSEATCEVRSEAATSEAGTQLGISSASAEHASDESSVTHSPETATEVPHALEPTRGEHAAMASSQQTRSHEQAAGRSPESRTDGIGNRDSVERHAPDFEPPAFLARQKTMADYRPNCLEPDACRSSQLSHCYTCRKALEAAGHEVAA